MANYVVEALKKIEEFEGSVPWMYRDAAGHVTAGVGLLLADADAAARLPFLVGSNPATPGQLAAEFTRVNALPAGRPAQFYRQQGGPELSATAMDALLRTVVEGMADELAARVKNFDAMPEFARTALLDIAYNLGVEGLLQTCPDLVHAAETGAWRTAAARSFRAGAVLGRNQWTRTMLLQAAPGATGDSGIKRLGYGVLGMVASWFAK